MSSLGRASVDLGAVEPAGSRHLGRRSTVLVGGERVLVGTADGDLVAYDRGLDERWRAGGTDDGASLVSGAVDSDTVVVGERGPAGRVRCYDRADGTIRWEYETASDIGEPQNETRFLLPFVAAVVTDGGRWYVTSRRYERVDGDRQFRSVVYAFAPDGAVEWRYETDASPISLDVRDERLAVAYNRCPGRHQCGLVVLDTETGDERLTWDPGTDGQRRVGDVTLVDRGLVLASHGDYCGYRLDDRGGEHWCVPLATPERIDGESVYAYPNHVHATADGVAFVTGNTYPEDGRETEARHPSEHTAFGYTLDGDQAWTRPVDGFATGIGTDDERIAVPAAQHFRDRDATAHGLGVFDLTNGGDERLDTDGVVTTAALCDDLVAAVEEPVAYHDEDETRGSYRLHVERLA